MTISVHTSRVYSTFLLLLLAMAAVLLGFTRCSNGSEADKTDEMEITQVVADISLTTEQFNSSEMTLTALRPHEFHQSVNTIGVFEVPPQNRASVSAYFGGYVKDINLLPGEKIKKGQVLFTLENPDYVQLQEDFLQTKSSLKYLEADYQRQKNLVEDNITSTKNFLKSEADYLSSKVKFESLKKRLILMNINPDKLSEESIRTVISVLAPINGFVTEIEATKGMFLNPSDVALSIIDPEHMHLELILFEKDIAAVQVDQPIKFNIQNDNQIEYDASVHLINKSIDTEKRTVVIHGHLTNESDLVRFTPGMYVEARILTKAKTAPALPEVAIVNLEDKNFVLVRRNASTSIMAFEQVEVKTGLSSDGFIEILNSDDFDADTEILGEGAFNLLR